MQQSPGILSEGKTGVSKGASRSSSLSRLKNIVVASAMVLSTVGNPESAKADERSPDQSVAVANKGLTTVFLNEGDELTAKPTITFTAQENYSGILRLQIKMEARSGGIPLTQMIIFGQATLEAGKTYTMTSGSTFKMPAATISDTFTVSPTFHKSQNRDLITEDPLQIQIVNALYSATSVTAPAQIPYVSTTTTVPSGNIIFDASPNTNNIYGSFTLGQPSGSFTLGTIGSPISTEKVFLQVITKSVNSTHTTTINLSVDILDAVGDTLTNADSGRVLRFVTRLSSFQNPIQFRIIQPGPNTISYNVQWIDKGAPYPLPSDNLNVRFAPQKQDYASWTNTFDLRGENADMDADPDKDGSPNSAEWGFGTDPNQPDNGALLDIKVLKDRKVQPFLTQPIINPSYPGFVLQESNDLSTWTTNSSDPNADLSYKTGNPTFTPIDPKDTQKLFFRLGPVKPTQPL